MPRLNGLELAARLLGGRPETRVLLMSGYAEFSAPPDAPFLEQAPRLMKPFRIGEVPDQVRKMLDGRPPFGN
jgi:YesN/AraC family two-component response regulator